MALSEKSRHEIYQHFTTSGMREDTINDMLSYFPARDVEEPLTKEHLSTELAALRLEFRTELHDGLDGLRGELRGEMNELRGDMHAGLAGLRNEMQSGHAELRGEMHELRGETQRHFFWLMGTMGTMVMSMIAVLITLLAKAG